MPIYEYLCLTCGGEFEVMQKVSDPPPRRHTCSPKSKVKRKLSLTAFQLKGGGWYAEGYAKGNGASAKEKPGAASESKGESKAESKKEPAATKSETKSDSGSSSAAAPASTKAEKPTPSPST